MEQLPLLHLQPSLFFLFILSFLAATFIPVGSEWLLTMMILGGFSPTQTVITATLGNYIGGCTTYLIGVYGAELLINTLLRVNDADLLKAKQIYEKYGSWSLLLSWLPVVGDPLCLLAGIFKIRFIHFSLLVVTGKFLRYATLALLAVKIS